MRFRGRMAGVPGRAWAGEGAASNGRVRTGDQQRSTMRMRRRFPTKYTGASLSGASLPIIGWGYSAQAQAL